MKRKILIVEDDVAQAKMLEEYMLMHDFYVHLVDNGDDVLQECRVYKPDVVLLDIGLYGISGVDACALIRSDEELKDTVIFAVTALHYEEFLQEYKRRKMFDDYVEKPVIMRELLEKINNYVSRV